MSAGEEDACSLTSSNPSSPSLEIACENQRNFSQLGFHGPSSPSSTSSSSSSTRPKTESKPKQVKECKVCGDDTTGTYFGAVVCLPCKTFFIRYGTEGGLRLRCRNRNNCPVTMSTRTRCKYCRLMKCFSVGMARKERPEVIHAAHGQELCSVCSDIANGIHFGTYTCEGCKKFFRRGLKEHQSYRCAVAGHCVINPRSRNTCRYCRYQKCLDVGMTSKVRVGRPRKLQRESILHAAQGRHLLKNATINPDGASSRHGSNDYFHNCQQSLPISDGFTYETQSPAASIYQNTCPVHNNPDDSQHLPGTYTVWQGQPARHIIEISPTHSTDSSHSASSLPETRHEEQRKADNARERTDEERLEAGNNCALPVLIDGYTYVLSDTLRERFYQTILPYWRSPLIPSGDLTLSPQQKTLIQNVTSCHRVAINGLCGSLPSTTVVTEALSSIEMTRSVAEYMRLRLVRILTSFISFIKSQPVFQEVQESDMSLLLRMNVSTWALLGAATHFFSPLSDSLPRSLVDIELHPDNPHAALNERNLRLARRLHALNMDDSEAALLSIICVLSTDLAKMKDPELVLRKRWDFLETFQAYATLKYGRGNGRLEQLFALVPEMRLAAIWFNDLSYLTWFPGSS